MPREDIRSAVPTTAASTSRKPGPIAISARHLALPIPVGREPVTCRMDPSGELLLVANQESNDLAVIKLRTSSLLTMVPVGSHPTDIVSLLF